MLIQAPAMVVGPAGAHDFDLKDVAGQEADPRLARRSEDCGTSDAAEIVVCGRRGPTNQRLEALPSDFEEAPLVAESGLLGEVRGKLSVQSVEFPSGMKSNRVMITIKTPF